MKKIVLTVILSTVIFSAFIGVFVGLNYAITNHRETVLIICAVIGLSIAVGAVAMLSVHLGMAIADCFRD